MTKNSTKKTQDFVSVKEIRDGVIILKNGTMISVLMTSSLNFALKSQDEQKAILTQFQNFLNSLEYSTQIYIQSKKLDIRQYIAVMEERRKEQTNELIKIQTKEYIDFIKNFTENVNIVSKNFFIIISYNPPTIQAGNGLSKIFSKSKNPTEKKSSFEEGRTQLEQRVSVVEQGLTRTGLRLARLGTEETVELLYKIFNPGESEKPVQLN
ncbi:MAG: TraC family protein [Patescibacteria group bacterium]|nr:TraC family protein [Patescibacteria group bacterium]